MLRLATSILAGRQSPTTKCEDDELSAITSVKENWKSSYLLSMISIAGATASTVDSADAGDSIISTSSANLNANSGSTLG